MDFLTLVKGKVKLLQMDEKFLYRAVNEGFSGGEKKRNEILQAAVLEPKLCILDETDSGLDIDALRIVAEGVNSLRSPERSFLMITHYQRLLDYIKPDVVHVLADNYIVRPAGQAGAGTGKRLQLAGRAGGMMAAEQSTYSYLTAWLRRRCRAAICRGYRI